MWRKVHFALCVFEGPRYVRAAHENDLAATIKKANDHNFVVQADETEQWAKNRLCVLDRHYAGTAEW